MHDAVRATIRQAVNAMVILDGNQRLLDWNEAWRRLLPPESAQHFLTGQLWDESCRLAGWSISQLDSPAADTDEPLLCVDVDDGSSFNITRTHIKNMTLLAISPGRHRTDTTGRVHHPLVRVVENFPQPAYIRRKDHLVTVNQGFASLLAYDTPEELMCTRRISDHFEKCDREQIREIFDSGGIVLDDARMIDRLGQIVEVVVVGVDFQVDGEAYRCNFLKDATAERKSKLDLRLSEERFRDFAFCAADWFWETDASLLLSHVSLERAEHFGVNPTRRQGQQDRQVAARIHPDNLQIDWSVLDDLQRNHLPITNYEYTTKDNDGRIRYLQLNAQPVFDAGGSFQGYRGASRDITYEKDIERSLIRARKRAEKQTEAKSEFLASVSHELRTPLTNILGYIELLQRQSESGVEGLSDEQKRKVDIIWRNGDHLRSLINNVISIERLGSGFDRVDPRRIDIDELLEEIRASFAVAVAINNSELTVYADLDMRDEFCTDSTKLRQILHNLIGNAVKFTEHGLITVEVCGDDAGLKIVIEDNGPGMSLNNLQRVNASSDQSTVVSALENGEGLGLLLSQRYVEQLGGRIRCKSEAQRGTCMTILLPDLGEPEQALTEPATASMVDDATTKLASKPLRVLVVDDNAEHRELLLSQLDNSVDLVWQASNGPDGLQLFRSQRPDIVFLDVRMPSMDGRVLARQVRTIEREAQPARRPCRLVAITADGLSSQSLLAVHGVFDACVTKPYHESDITTQLAYVAGKTPGYDGIKGVGD